MRSYPYYGPRRYYGPRHAGYHGPRHYHKPRFHQHGKGLQPIHPLPPK
jgi:hypothetical protein